MDNLVERFLQLYEEGQYQECVSIGKWLLHIYSDEKYAKIKAQISYNLGCVYLELEDYDEAAKLLSSTTNAMNKQGIRGESYIHALSNLAIARHMQGEAEKAIYLQNIVVNLLDKQMGFKSKEATDARYNLANFHFDGEDYTEATAAHLRVLERREKGTEEMIDSLCSLAYCYEAKKDYEMAFSYTKKALRQIKSLDGEETYDYVALLLFGSKLLDKLDKEDNAIRYGERALKITNGDVEYIAAEIEINDWLSDISYAYGKLDRAIRYKQSSVEKFREYSDDYHLVLANGYNRLAQLFVEKNDLRKVSYYLNKALEMKENLLGVTHINYIKDVLTASVFWIENKEYATAYKHLNHIFDAFEDNEEYADFQLETEILMDVLELFDSLDPESEADFDSTLSTMMEQLEDVRAYFDEE